MKFDDTITPYDVAEALGRTGKLKSPAPTESATFSSVCHRALQLLHCQLRVGRTDPNLQPFLVRKVATRGPFGVVAKGLAA